MSKILDRLPRAPKLAAAFALLASLFAALPASAGTTVTLFQQQVELDCASVTCYAFFPDLPPNQALDIKHVYCRLYSTGKAYLPYVSYHPQPAVSVPLGLIWEGSAVAQKIYSFAIDTHLRVPLGRQLRVYVGTDNGPAAFGDCTAIGNRLTNS